MEIPGWSLLIHGLASLLVFINDSIGGNPGLAIIVFTIIVRLATLPLTLKGLQSSRNMQSIQPLVKAIQQKHKDDKAKQQQETMKLYSEHGVNPMLGCLPMLLQLPIFLALYQALISLVNPQIHVDVPLAWVPVVQTTSTVQAAFAQSFLWVPNLAGPDPVGIGFIHLLPILAALFQFISGRMAVPYGYSKTADSQQQTMNNMMMFMPLIIIFFYSNFAAGAVLYWAVSSLFGAVQQYFITGFGALAEIPFLRWLPKKELPKITPKVIARLEEEQQKEARRGSANETPTPSPAPAATTKYRSETQPAPATGPAVADNRPQRKGLFDRVMEQAMALQDTQQAARAGVSANGADDGATRPMPAPGVETVRLNGSPTANGNDASAGSPLPRKKRGKR